MTEKKPNKGPDLQANALKRIENKGIVFDMPSCGGCRTCEMACSFHHTGEFAPALSSLVVLDKEDGPGCEVLLMTESDGQRIACDGCEGLEIPLCMEYCRESDDLWKILQEFEETRKLGKANKKDYE